MTAAKAQLNEWLDAKIGECVVRLDALELEETAAQVEYELADGDGAIQAEDAIYSLRYDYHRTLGRKQAYEEVLSFGHD